MTADALPHSPEQLVGLLQEELHYGPMQLVALQALLPDDALHGVNNLDKLVELLPHCIPGSRLDQLVLARLKVDRIFNRSYCGVTSDISPLDAWWRIYRAAPKGSSCRQHALDQLGSVQGEFRAWTNCYRAAGKPLRSIVWTRAFSAATTFSNWFWIFQHTHRQCEREVALLRMRHAPAERHAVVNAVRNNVPDLIGCRPLSGRLKALALRRLIELDPDSMETGRTLMVNRTSGAGRRQTWGRVQLKSMSLRELRLFWCWLKDCPEDYPRADLVDEIFSREATFEEWRTLQDHHVSTQEQVDFQLMVVRKMIHLAVNFDHWRLVYSSLFTRFQDERVQARAGLLATATTFEEWSLLETYFRPTSISWDAEHVDASGHARAQEMMVRLGTLKMWQTRLRHHHPTPFDTQNIIRLGTTLDELINAWKRYAGATEFDGYAVVHARSIMRAIAELVATTGEPFTAEQLQELHPWPYTTKVTPLRRVAG